MLPWQKEARFSRVSQDSDEEQDVLMTEPKLTIIQTTARQASTRSIVASLIAVWLLGMAAGGVISQVFLLSTRADTCARYTTQYSPVLKDVDIEYSAHHFNGSLLKPTVYRQDAGPEVDAAWEEIGVDYRAAIVPYEEGLKSGLKADQVKVSQKYGGGFLANVEGLHQIHCLNVLRQALYFNYDHYHALGKGAFANSERILKFHVTHCLDILRQQLMCTVDTGLLGQVWFDPENPSAYVDFNTRHTCKNFDAVREWAKERQAPLDAPEDFLEPPKEGDKIYSEIP